MGEKGRDKAAASFIFKKQKEELIKVFNSMIE